MSSALINFFYPVENYMKLIFIFMAIINANYTVLLAFTISAIAILRILKTPQFSKQYLGKVLLNNHGQNLMYIGMGAMGQVNFLFYSPLILFFGFGIIQFVNQKYPNTSLAPKYMPFVNMVRNNKYYVMQGRGKLEITYFLFSLVTLPLDFFNKLLKVVLLGQYLLLKFKISNQFRFACSEVHKLFDSKTKSIGFINSLYNKIIDKMYAFATADPRAQQPAQQ